MVAGRCGQFPGISASAASFFLFYGLEFGALEGFRMLQGSVGVGVGKHRRRL